MLHIIFVGHRAVEQELKLRPIDVKLLYNSAQQVIAELAVGTRELRMCQQLVGMMDPIRRVPVALLLIRSQLADIHLPQVTNADRHG